MGGVRYEYGTVLDGDYRERECNQFEGSRIVCV